MAKPKVSEVSAWYLDKELSNEIAQVLWSEDHLGLFAKVTTKGSKPKYFYGELAWQDAKRLAGDIYTKHVHAF